MENNTVVVGGKMGALTEAIALLNAERYAQGFKPIVLVDDLPTERIDLIDYTIKEYDFKISNSISLSDTSYKKNKKVDKRFTSPKKKRRKK